MAVPATDIAVDAAITRLQDALDVLKSAQKKDDAYYAKEDDDKGEKPAKNLKGAEKTALTRVRAQKTSENAAERTRSKSDAQAGVPQPSDRLK